MDDASELEWRESFNFVTGMTGDAECPFCGENTWHTVDSQLAVRVLDDAGRALDEVGYPVIALTCGSCGFVRFHSSAAVREIRS